MSIRIPSSPVLQFTTTTTTTDSQTILLPQDVDGVVVQLYTGTFTGTNPTLDCYVQTSPDGGSTWYDMGNLGQIVAAVSAQNSRWGFFSVSSAAKRTQGASILDIGAAAASTAGSSAYTGLPILGQNLRIYVKVGGTQVVNAGTVIRVYANSQSNRA